MFELIFFSILAVIILSPCGYIFNKHNTKYKIVISPVYDQVPMEEEQLEVLEQIFGKQNIYNFSGKNKFTDSIHNFYETSHYKPNVANEIMNILYEDR